MHLRVINIFMHFPPQKETHKNIRFIIVVSLYYSFSIRSAGFSYYFSYFFNVALLTFPGYDAKIHPMLSFQLYKLEVGGGVRTGTSSLSFGLKGKCRTC